MTCKRKMKQLLQSIIIGMIATIAAIGAISVLPSCAPVPAIGALAAGVGGASCITPERAAELDNDLNLALIEALDEAAAGSITGEELTVRLRSALVTYGQELRTAIVTDTTTRVAGELGAATQQGAAGGGVIGIATAIASWFLRERSWKTRREPAVVEAAKKNAGGG